jgi:putative membrane protein
VDQIVTYLPHVNASLNAVATLLLVTGYVLIQRRREIAHQRYMTAALLVSAIFLVCYLVYHANTTLLKRFPDYPPDLVRYTYYLVLTSHSILAAAVPVLALATAYLGWRDRRLGHARLGRWTFPIWLYVSVTGVIIYLMLYQFFPSPLE